MPVVVTEHVWSEIAGVLSARGPRRVAVAFLGADAPRLMPKLTAGDLLVCNASDRALKSGATSPDALAAFVERGVAVFSRADLHAKVYASRRTAFIGSANASITSAGQREAGVLLDDLDEVKATRAFVERLAESGAISVDDTFIEVARKLSPPPRGSGPTAGGESRSSRPLHVARIDTDDDVPVAVGRAIDRTRRKNGFEGGEAAGTIECNWFPKGSWRRGDRALFVYEQDGVEVVDPPARCLWVEPVSPRSRLEVAWWEYPTAENGLWAELVQHLLEHGHRLSEDHKVRSAEAQALIEEWFGVNEGRG